MCPAKAVFGRTPASASVCVGTPFRGAPARCWVRPALKQLDEMLNNISSTKPSMGFLELFPPKAGVTALSKFRHLGRLGAPAAAPRAPPRAPPRSSLGRRVG